MFGLLGSENFNLYLTKNNNKKKKNKKEISNLPDFTAIFVLL